MTAWLKSALLSLCVVFGGQALAEDGTNQGGSLGYYWQSVRGHMSMLGAAKPIEDWLADPATSEATKTKLRLAQQVRVYASDKLGLPNNASYTRYADLQRSAVVWNVVAAPANSLQLKTWCFMVAGCVSYRGYYKEADAKKTEAALKAQGLETQVYGVPAYSTLGKLNWLGGDPLLNTFLNYPDVEMARLVFHELAHQVLYVNDDTTFNESFATAVERIGTDLWLAERGNPEARRVFEEREARQKQWRALQMRTRDRLSVVYAKNIEKKSTLPSVSIDSVAAISIANNSDWKAQKTAVMADFQREYLVLKASWNDYSGYDASAARANNASIGSAAAYDELVPQFLAVYEKQGRSMSAFYDAIKALVALPREDRRRALAAAANP